MPLEIPRKMQPWLASYRWKFAMGGRGGGKSWAAAGIALAKGRQKPMRILCCREVQKSIKGSVHQLLKDCAIRIGLGDFYTATETEIRGNNGTQFIFAGLRELGVDQLKSLEGVDIAWVEEAQTISQRSIDVLAPTIRKPGSEIWMVFNQTFETDPVYKMAMNPPDNSLVVEIGMDDNPWAKETELPAQRDEDYRTKKKAEADHIWAGKCRPTAEGAIYEEEMDAMVEQNRITTVPYDQAASIVVAFDLGWGDYTSIVVGQFVGKERHIFTEYENHLKKFDHYIDWLKRLPYRIDVIELPHDARANRLETGAISIFDECRAAFPQARINCPKGAANAPSIETGINNARQKFAYLYIDKSCARLVDCLRKYHRKKDESTGIFGDPDHDSYSHKADAFRYWMLHQPVQTVVSQPYLGANASLMHNPF